MLNRIRLLLHHSSKHYSSIKKHIDYSKVPVLNECDLNEQYVKGSGPGGSKISTTSSCVVLKHIPTGLIVKCQETRFLIRNKKIAREILVRKVDNFLNGNDSVESQTKRYLEKRRLSFDSKKAKMKQLKEEWKQREHIT